MDFVPRFGWGPLKIEAFSEPGEGTPASLLERLSFPHEGVEPVGQKCADRLPFLSRYDARLANKTCAPSLGCLGSGNPHRHLTRMARAGTLEKAGPGRYRLATSDVTEGIPSVAYPPMRVTRIAPVLFDLGIEQHRIEGGVVRVYSVARTVVDCFRFRNRVGLDVAMEALIDARRSRRLDLNEVDRVAKALRLDRVMRPYREMLVA